jgi:hypothetical protein
VAKVFAANVYKGFKTFVPLNLCYFEIIQKHKSYRAKKINEVSKPLSL